MWRLCLHSGNALDSYSGCGEFESQVGHPPSVRFLMVFLSSSTQMLGWYLR